MISVCDRGPGTSRTEGFAMRTAQKDSLFIGKPTAVDWLYACPQGMENVVTCVKDRYNNIPMFITENGFGEMENKKSNSKGLLNDVQRVEYMSSYLYALARAVREGADVRGYFAWSLLDNFEWTSGYTISFGLYHVNFATQERTRKLSATWYKNYIAKHNVRRSCT